MKWSIALFLIGCCCLSISGFAQSEVSAIILPFENTDATSSALDTSGSNRDLGFAQPEIVTIPAEGAKIGGGSLLVTEEPRRTIFTQSLQDPQYAAWAGPIEKLSIVMWVYIPADVTRNELTLISRNYNFGTGTPGYFIFSISSAAGLRFVATDNNPVRSGPNTASLKSGAWTHLAMVYDKGEVRFYQDGEALPAIGNTSSNSIAAFEQVDKKTQITGLEKLPAGGRVDDIGLFLGVALSDGDIRSIESKGLEAFVKAHPETVKAR